MRKLFLVAVVFLFATLVARAQSQMDVAVGAGTTSGQSASSAGIDYAPQNIGGGTYLTFSGDYLFWKGLGVGGEISWRASRNLWGGYLPFRPVLYDFNGVYAPKLGERAALELQAGIGAESVRFYTGGYTCSSFTGCTTYQSTNHFMGHFGGGIRLYATPHFFIRPEAHIYLVRNNFEFSGPRVARYGVSLGYTFGGQ